MENYPNNPKYKIIEKLGEGSFGAAYKVLNLDDNNIYVIKRILLKNTQKEEIKNIQNEAKILSSIKHENIVKFYDFFIDNDSFNIIMEFCEGLDLRKYILEHKTNKKPINTDIIFHIIKDISIGLKIIHDKKLIHRDLKPDNLFFTSEYRVKIGDFGIAKQLSDSNNFAKTQAGTLLYMAPEIINGKKYNNKVDMWSLGCIIHELCTLDYCFEGKNINELIENIKKSNHKKIDQNIYCADSLQKIIDHLLLVNYEKRIDVECVLDCIKTFFISMEYEKLIKKFNEDESFQNLVLEKCINNSLDQVGFSVLAREKKFNKMKAFFFIAIASAAFGFCCIPLSLITIVGLGISFMFNMPILVDKLIKEDEKEEFIKNNFIIINLIQNKLIQKIKEEFEKSLVKEKIIIYNKENFNKQIERIKQKLKQTSYIEKLKKIVAKNFNILLLGCTNAGKSTLINEFLHLDEKEKAKESEGGPTDTIDFTEYSGARNNKIFNLYDTNGITNDGKDQIENKKNNTVKEIEKRIESKDPNQLIHCIWYCLQGSNVQPSDGDFIEKLLNIYKIYSIPIIFVHTQTYSKKQSETCKKGIEKYLNTIFNNDKVKVKQQLDNYIDILARGEDYIQSFGLDILEKVSIKEIEIKGFKSAYIELIKKDLMPVLINVVFNIIFNDYNLNKMKEYALEDLKKYLEMILNIINSPELQLSDFVKNENKRTLNNIYKSFNNIKDNIKDDLKDLLKMKKLKSDNEDILKEVYESKSEQYKKKISFSDFCKKVEKLIYDNLSNQKKEIINNSLNVSFNNYVIDLIKEGITEQFKENEKEKKILEEIYIELFK